MNRRTTLMSMALLSLVACACPQASFAQSSLLTGTWKLNLAKSKYSPGPPPKSGNLTYRAEGQNVRRIAEGVDSEGKPRKSEWLHIYDGQPHPTPGVAGYDTTAYTRVDAHTVTFSRTNAGKPTQTGSVVISGDGKSLTVTTTGTGPTGQQFNNLAVYDKQ